MEEKMVEGNSTCSCATTNGCSVCNGNHYVAKARLVTTTDKVSYSNHSNINLYSDLNNYINCPICIKPDATNTDNGPGTNSQ